MDRRQLLGWITLAGMAALPAAAFAREDRNSAEDYIGDRHDKQGEHDANGSGHDE